MKIINYRKVILLIILLFINNCIASDKIGLTQDVYFKLCGIWDTEKFNTETDEFSWGSANIVINHSLIIDLGEDDPFFFMGGVGKLRIIKINQSNNLYKMIIKDNFFKDTDNREYTLEFKYNNDDTITFQKMNHQIIQDYRKYYKFDGPLKAYYKTKFSNLQLRLKPSLNSKIQRIIKRDEKIVLLKKGNTENINNVKETWDKVLTEKNEIGWCFDSYLEAY